MKPRPNLPPDVPREPRVRYWIALHAPWNGLTKWSDVNLGLAFVRGRLSVGLIIFGVGIEAEVWRGR